MTDGWPVALAFAFLTVLGFCRAGATYLIGRGVRHWGSRRRASSEQSRTPSPTLQYAERLVRRLGPVAVPLSFLTVGLQTAIHLTAGALRMPGRYYVPALAVGALIWATLYTTVGLAVLHTVWGRVDRWVLVSAVAAVVVVVVVNLVLRRRRDRLAGRAD
ncbi:DedA family protein [Nocardioides massiliensis]|uniref:Membrane protein DedA with SNARE-associated domain n=1 Tax=Nocardioides massiliensis TaxID=1325935 RepID=A0ABT9NSI0_9ACTN|nr:VTT domain-containing protein [Nocardioides massiliensis]MDP9823377.1 membrane protein DedA with SNARE-associated domain [Nocardioides massiliensis]